jgi:phosphate transport system protein
MAAQARGELDRGLQEVQDDILRLGTMVMEAIEQSMSSLKNRDLILAEQVIEHDEAINELRYQIEEACIRITATQQPAAVDLREIMTAMIIANELERMGDHAEGIARIVVRMGEEPLVKPLIDLPRMADTCRRMISSALDAYTHHNVLLAREVASQDDTIDELYEQIFRELITFIIEDPKVTTRALYLLFAAHNLERIGDRVTNITERAVFVASGEIREMNPEPEEADLK